MLLLSVPVFQGLLFFCSFELGIYIKSDVYTLAFAPELVCLVRKVNFSARRLFVFTGILGFDVFLDENGDVHQNLTVLAFSEQGGEKSVCLYVFFSQFSEEPVDISLFNSS